MRIPSLLRVLLAAALLFSCTGSSDKPSADPEAGPPSGGKVALNGAGATFPFPLYSKWMSEYNKRFPHIQINYQSIGSGGGIRQVTSGTVDFGATDAPMEPEANKTSSVIHHVPTTIGAVVIAYSAPGVPSGLRLDGKTLAAIFLGRVTRWDAPELAASNPGVKLPSTPITVVYRSDGSGTTAVFTDYLARVEPAFAKQVGVGKSVRWPKGLGAKGNEGVTGQLKVSPGAIGYIELAYATQNKLPIASIQNKAGRFIAPEVAGITAAAAGAELPDELFASIADSPGADAYPIASFTYLLVHQDAQDEAKGRALAEFLWWAIHEGQQFSAALHYAPLPPAVITKVEARLRGLTYKGRPLLADR